MSPNEPIIITFKDFHGEVKKDLKELDDTLNKMKTQLAAQWIVHGLFVVVLTTLFGIGIARIT